MKTPKKRITIDPEMARYDNISLFPEKVAQAKASWARVDKDKLNELLAKPAQKLD